MRSKLFLSVFAVAIASVAFEGCFVWNYVSEGYRNFSAYFNTYYNASSAYNTALKDVRTSQKEFYISKIAGTSQGAYTISVVARQNFDLAIQEASKVLQFFPNSAFTEDCLYLVGISYYYEGNTMGGTREFTEAEDAFPRSRRIDEAEMYMGGLQLEAQQAHEGYENGWCSLPYRPGRYSKA